MITIEKVENLTLIYNEAGRKEQCEIKTAHEPSADMLEKLGRALIIPTLALQKKYLGLCTTADVLKALERLETSFSAH